jgi:hypothetical protein
MDERRVKETRKMAIYTDPNDVKKRGCLQIGDCFRIIQDATQGIWGIWQIRQCVIHIPKIGMDTWFPKLSKSQNGPGDSNWENTFTGSSASIQDEITEEWKHALPRTTPVSGNLATFMKYTQNGISAYWFCGVYSCVSCVGKIAKYKRNAITLKV